MKESRAAPELLHQDDDFLVLLKPSALPTTSPAGGDSLHQRARSLLGKPSFLHPTSRLDSEVTGIVVFARTPRANAAILDARREGRYRRRYVALASRTPERLEGSWREAIALDPRDPRRRRASDEDDAEAKSAETLFRCVESTASGALLHLWPQSGRTHQLRVHASHAGLPLWGDEAYGGPKRCTAEDGSVYAARRVMLHCTEVCLEGVGRQPSLRFYAPPPEDMRQFWHDLGGSDLHW